MAIVKTIKICIPAIILLAWIVHKLKMYSTSLSNNLVFIAKINSLAQKIILIL